MKIQVYIMLLFSILVNAQSEMSETTFDSAIHQKIYSIEFGDCQRLEIIKKNDNTIFGSFTNCVWKLTKKQGKGKIITQKIQLKSSDAEALFSEFEKKNFDTVPNCENYGLDGTTTSFITQSKEYNNVANYWELESDYYKQDETDHCKFKDARNFTYAFSKYINIEGSFTDFLSSLPKGKYTFGNNIMKKK